MAADVGVHLRVGYGERARLGSGEGRKEGRGKKETGLTGGHG